MADLQVVYLRQLVPVEGVNLVSLTPPILAVQGRNFTNASNVRVNGLDVQYFVSTDSLILASLPEDISAATVDTVEVLSSTPADDSKSTRLEMALTSRPPLGGHPVRLNPVAV